MQRAILSLALSGAALAMVAAPAFARDARFIRSPAIGCTDRALVERAGDLREDGRGYDYQSLIRVALDTGECRRLSPGLLVVVEDSDILGGLTKLIARWRGR